MSQSFEEIRSVALDVLAGREQAFHNPTQYETLKLAIAEVFDRREGRPRGPRPQELDLVDSNIFLEVFWDLFRQGIITLGFNDANREFPHCRVTEYGRRILENQEA